VLIAVAPETLVGFQAFQLLKVAKVVAVEALAHIQD
jgi:hypothetical protein